MYRVLAHHATHGIAWGVLSVCEIEGVVPYGDPLHFHTSRLNTNLGVTSPFGKYVFLIVAAGLHFKTTM